MTQTTDTTTKPQITANEWRELEKFVFEGLIKNGELINKVGVGAVMYVYEKNFNLAAMYRYMKWAQEHDQSDDAILANIMHDLNGRHQDPKIFDPRSSSY
jgi:hypothetical protein